MLNAPPIPLMEYKKAAPQQQQRDALFSASSMEEIPVEPVMQYGLNSSAADRKMTI